jgi:single-stranded-DNA-specific exonuclease
MKIIKKPLDAGFIKDWINRGFNPIVLSIINRRGWDGEEDLLNVFLPLLENIPSPFLYRDIVKVFQRIDAAINKKEKILIFGDIDVDGVTSTAMLYDFLKNQDADVSWDIPVGDDPYGLNFKTIESWIGKYSLCITVDCGITNVAEIKFLKDHNIDTIVIDHHAMPCQKLDAFAVINPKNEENIDFDNIAACGVTFIFIFGYYFYKGSFFNKDIALVFKDHDAYNVFIYNNMIFRHSFVLKDYTMLDEYDDVFYYSDSSYDEGVPSGKKKVKRLKSAVEIYDSRILYNINNVKIRSRISLINYIFNNIKEFDYLKDKYLPLVLLGTIADIMPLTGVNRIFTGIGFNLLKTKNIESLKILFNELGIEPSNLTTKDLSWVICPLLNAPGRMGNARGVVEFLINNPVDETIKEMIKINKDRKTNGEKAYKLFLNKIDENKKDYNDSLLFFYSDDIQKGITGLTATKLSKYSKCPTIVAAKDGEFYTGSIRGETEHHLVEFLEKCSDLLDQFGGHKNAAGFRLHCDKLDDFKKYLMNNSVIFKDLDKEHSITIDAEIPAKYLNNNLAEIIKIFEPFGEKNPNPIFYTPDIEIKNYFWLGKEKKHLKLIIETPYKVMTAILWDRGEWFVNLYMDYEKYDIIYQIEQSRYNSVISTQLIILDIIESKRQ